MGPDADRPLPRLLRDLVALSCAGFAGLGATAAPAQESVCLAYRVERADFARHGIGPEEGLASVVEVLEHRLEASGAPPPTAAILGDDLVVVRLPPGLAADELRVGLARPGEFAVHRVERTFPTADLAVMLIGPDRMAYPSAQNPEQSYLVHRPPVLEGPVVADASAGRDNLGGEPVVSLRLREDARAAFAAATKASVGAQFAVVVDGVVLTAPVVREPIADGRVQITGGFTPEFGE